MFLSEAQETQVLLMIEELQRVLPEKSGEKSAKPWNFPKAHGHDHTGSKVMARDNWKRRRPPWTRTSDGRSARANEPQQSF